jgi:heme/copper-type cytochrome/quinol oxidase subunit 3
MLFLVTARQAVSRAHPARKPVVPNGVLGMIIFVLTEIMFFTGLVSAYLISEGAAPLGWPPPGQPRLPIGETAFNTAALIASGVVLFFAGRALKRGEAKAKWLLLAALCLGAFFVAFQGVEWVGLVSEGLTLTVTTHGSFFYLIVGVHGLHAVAAILGLAYVFGRLTNPQLTERLVVIGGAIGYAGVAACVILVATMLAGWAGTAVAGVLVAVVAGFYVLSRKKPTAEQAASAKVPFETAAVFWYFVVAVWPILYYLVYL